MTAAPVDPNDQEAVAAAALGLMIRATIQLAAAVISIVLVIRLMSAMRRPVLSIVLASIAQILPLIGLIVLLAVNGRATRICKEAGLKVGLLGAKV